MKKIILLFVLMLFLSFVYFLVSGVNVKHLQTSYFTLEDLYFKLDKKLILRLNTLQIHKQKQNSSSTKELTAFLENSHYAKTFFKEIMLDKIAYDNYSLALYFDGENFTLDTENLGLNATFDGKNAKIEFLELKDFKANFSGDLEVDFNASKTSIDGTFSSFDVNGTIKALAHKNILEFELFDVNATSIVDFCQNLSKNITFDDEIKKWLTTYTNASNYNISNFYGKIDMKSARILELNGKGSADDVNVVLDPKLTPIKAARANAELKDDILSFEFIKPSYNNKDLNASSLKIINIVKDDTHAIINLISNEISLNDAKPILSHFGIETGDFSLDARTKTALNIDVKMNPFNVSANGNFVIAPKQAFKAFGASFSTSGINVDLNDTKFTFKKANLENELVNLDFSGILDFDKNLGKFSANVKKAYLGRILDIKDKKVSATLDMNKNFEIRIPELNFIGNFAADKNNNKNFQISDISEILPYSAILKDDINASSGSLSAQTNDFKNFDANFNINFDIGLTNHDKIPYNTDKFIFKGSSESFNITSASSHVSVQNTKERGTQIFINDLLIPLSAKDDTSSNTGETITFIGKNSGIILQDFNRSFLFSEFRAKLGAALDFSAKYGDKSEITAHKDKDKINMFGLNMSERFINDILGIKAFDGGKFDLRLSGKDFSHFIAMIDAKDTYLSQFKAQQNLLSFFDTIPSLISFKVPDFSAKGFNTKKAHVVLDRNASFLNIKALELNGGTADIYGSGGINLDTNDIKMQLEISVLKSASSLLAKIPIVNHIILGDDRKMSTIVDISGKLSDPKYSTSIAADILMTPFNLIKNTLTLPFNMFK